MSQPIDQQQRISAIIPQKSFIVQAPAGSGKTELLSQRYLTLLATVNQPEEILALTFTKKAAAEMRERILHALHNAAKPFNGQSEHERKTYDLACSALKQDQTHDWQLSQNPNRMKIQTLDSLAAKISKTRPLLTEGCSTFRIEDNPLPYYQIAARNVIEYINDPEVEWQQSIYTIIKHLDVNLFKLENLFINILARREQWLPYLLNASLEEQIENALTQCQQQALNKLKQLPADLISQWFEIGYYVDRQLETEQFKHENLATWKALINLAMTKDYKFRKRLDKNLGFPPPSGTKDKLEKEERQIFKDKMIALIATLQEELPSIDTFKEIVFLPELSDFGPIKPLMSALKDVLPVLTAELKHIFNTHHIIDFNELTSLAQTALCDNQAPTDLQLKLDYQIKHILVDEFQDTSINQYQLLQNLTAGWEPNDGRTLFFVGDPMQSIYRFRQAEVGLFLKVQQGFFGSLPINSIQLQSNFRSSPQVIQWVNNVFQNIFPSQNITHLGAVHYSHSTPERDFSGNVSGTVYLDDNVEAEAICNLINEKTNEGLNVAILVRSRNHLVTLSKVLQQKQIQYNATELDLLIDDPLCLDLLTLTEVICDPSQKLAWLALLRSPFCGLDLKSLYQLSQDNSDNFFEDLKEKQNLLEDEPKRRIEKCLAIMAHALQFTKKVPLAELVHKLWLSFNGPQILKDPDQGLKVANKYFEILENHEDKYFINDFIEFSSNLARYRIDESHGNQCKVEIMTIHKSKGLEFDVVILPQLHRIPSHGDQQILLWSEFTDDEGIPHFLLAPIKNNNDEPFYDYLQYLNKSKEQYELQRLLYVACTRAKRELYLTGVANMDEEDNIKQPSASTLLGLLWEHHSFKLASKTNTDIVEESTHTPTLNQIPMPKYETLSDKFFEPYQFLKDTTEHPLDYANWQTQTGSLIHFVFSELLLLPEYKINMTLIQRLVNQYQIESTDQPQALQLIEMAIKNLTEGKHSAWLLNSYQEKSTEFEIISYDDEQNMRKQFIDLTFVDQNNIRWIVDHKIITSSSMTHDKLRQTYSSQLQAYRDSFKQIEKRECKMALYLPIQDQLIEIA